MNENERYHRLTLRGDGPTGVDITEVLIDDKKVKGVTAVRLSVTCDGFSEATISLYVRPDFNLPMSLEAVSVCECGPCPACNEKRSAARTFIAWLKLRLSR